MHRANMEPDSFAALCYTIFICTSKPNASHRPRHRGQLDEAIAMLENMPFQPNLVSFGSILSACRNGDNVELGRQALECATVLGRDIAPAFISMSNVYATAHMWEDVETIKAIIQAWKTP
eukprot:c24551_g2_i3 orf=172-531(+)